MARCNESVSHTIGKLGIFLYILISKKIHETLALWGTLEGPKSQSFMNCFTDADKRLKLVIRA